MAKLVRWNPTYSPAQRAFEELWQGNVRRNGLASPALDVINHEDHVEVRVDLPGIAPENVNIEVKDGILTISTQVASDETHESSNYSYRERYQGSYQRSLRVPETIDTEHAEANFENGVLTLKLPRQPEAQPLRIPVKGTANTASKN